MTQCGFVYINGKKRPFKTFREILTGNKKGKFEIPVNKIVQSQDKSWTIKPINRVVHKDQILRFPGSQNAEQKAG